MTMEDKLYSMKVTDLIRTADNLGVPILCNKHRTQLKESREVVVNRILSSSRGNNAEVAHG